MKDSPRYQNVVAAGPDAKGFAQGLQKPVTPPTRPMPRS